VVNRSKLIADVATSLGPLPPTQQEALQAALDTTLVKVVAALSLDSARRLDGQTRAHLAEAFSDCFNIDGARAQLKAWDPLRRDPASLTHTEAAEELCALLSGAREPYKPRIISLEAARSLPTPDKELLAYDIRERMSVAINKPVGDLVALLANWDQHWRKSTSILAAIPHILALLAGEIEPAPKPLDMTQLKQMALSSAQELDANRRAEAVEVIRRATDRDLKGLLTKWDVHGAAAATDCSKHLLALLAGEIEPAPKPLDMTQLKQMALSSAQELDANRRAEAVEVIKRATDRDLKGLLRNWDVHGAAAATDMPARIGRLLALVEGAEPAAAPPRPSRRNTRRT
jgi:hypothetical protein